VGSGFVTGCGFVDIMMLLRFVVFVVSGLCLCNVCSVCFGLL